MFLAGVVFVSVIVGVVESVMARLRLVHIPTLLGGGLSAVGLWCDSGNEVTTWRNLLT